jgi:hypothetical protein
MSDSLSCQSRYIIVPYGRELRSARTKNEFAKIENTPDFQEVEFSIFATALDYREHLS